MDENDIELLMEALDAWEKDRDGALTALLGGMLTHDKNERDSFVKDTLEKGRAETRTRRDRAVLLKAKLIKMRDELIVADALTQIK